MSGHRWLARCAGAVVALVFLTLGGLAHESYDPQFVGVSSSVNPGKAAAASPSPSAAPSQAAADQAPTTVSWLSGAGGSNVADGSFAKWRGQPLTAAGTWDDGNDRMLALKSVCPGGDWSTWNKPLDLAVGAIERDKGETWAKAAKGAYDSRWRKSLTKLKQCWGKRDPANLYIRFAHEYNIRDMRWRVMGGEEADFVKAITRYSDLRYEILPQAKIVLCPSDGTSGSQNIDLFKTWPGKDSKGRLVANVYGVDTYNSWIVVDNPLQFRDKLVQLQSKMPLGIELHRRMAENWGVPFVVSEWANNGDPKDEGKGGEHPVYMQLMNEWFRAYAGDPKNPQPGKLLYEIFFNDQERFMIHPTKHQPRTAAAYKKLTWGK